MKLKTSAWVILIALLIELLVHAVRWSAQDRVRRLLSVEPRAARVETSEALDTPQVLMDEDIGPVAVSVKDNPADVVNKAAWSLIADTMHSCTSERIDPSYRAETLMEVAGPDRVHLSRSVQSGNPQPPYEVIVIGTDQYHRDSDGPWQKDAQDGSHYLIVMHQMPIGFFLGSQNKDLKLIRRDVIGGSPTFKYEVVVHPGGVITRDTILDIWIGIKDGLPRKYLMRPAEKIFNPQLIERDTFTCSYVDVPNIEPPILLQGKANRSLSGYRSSFARYRSRIVVGETVRRGKALDFSGCKSRPGTGSLHPVAIETAVET